MKIANDITKSLMQKQIDAMEKRKYESEGTERTAGSYMLTYSKSMLTLSDQDEEVFDEYSKYAMLPVVVAVAGTLAVSLTGMKAYEKLKEHHKNKKNKLEKENK